MSTSKHIDLICLVVSIFALLLTGLFINGEALGLTPIEDGDAGSDQFTANDLNADWDTSSATQITLTGDSGSVKGSGAYIDGGDIHILYAGEYVISGELSDGSVIIDAGDTDKIWILLNGVSLHCEDSAAILIEQAEKVFLTLASGTENSISSGTEYTESAVSNGIDGAIYSRDDLTINGSGSLTVTAAYKHGIVGNDDLVITGGTINVTAAQDGVHANDSVRFANADLTVNAGDDGITVSNDDETAYLYVESGNINILSCYEGLEAIDITIAGGTIDIRPTDDGINANGRGSNSAINITGGDITIINETGRDADGLDSNGDIYISGGNTFISVSTSSCALDYGSENGGVSEVSGGTVIAAGGSSMAEGFDSTSEQNFIMYTTSTAASGTTVTLKNEAGTTLISESIPCSFSSIVISTPELQLGETCSISIGDSLDEITVDNSSSSGGFGMGGMFGGGMQQGGFGMGDMFGGRGGKAGQFSGNQPNASDENTAESQPQDMLEMPNGDTPQMPDGNFSDGEAPQMPDGDFSDGEAPQMPDDDFSDGEAPQMPDGDFSDGEMPQMPDGDFSDGEMPQMPDGDFSDGEMPQTPDGGNRRGGDQFMREDQNWNWEQSNSSATSPDALILVCISVLFLLAGILIAFKVKH